MVNAYLLVGVLFSRESGPVDGAACKDLDAVMLWDGATSDAITASKDDGLNGAIKLGQRDLKRDLSSGR